MTYSLIPVTNRPLNAETPLPVLQEVITPAHLFYVRNHFDIPPLDESTFELRVDGAVARPLTLSLAEIKALPSKTLHTAMECAGNGRIFMEPKPAGTPWELGAISVAEWTGAPLVDVLKLAGIDEAAVEVLFVGADNGIVEKKAIHYERSLPLSLALNPDILLVWAMNDEPLLPEHGYPLRLFIPGWYGMASVKWLRQIRLITVPFDGYYQTYHYVYWDDDYAPDGQPLRQMQVRALICSHDEGAHLPHTEAEISGVAWSGYAEVTRVEISTTHDRWEEARVERATTPSTTQRWSYRWQPPTPGEYTLRVRAMDALGNTQPLRHRSNRLGYGNNAVHSITVMVDVGG
jgi:DMSO/TMAO reductase YedYZ molybdopterin-dependent catalytic subunit